MRLFAAIQPPAEVLAEVLEVVREAAPEEPVPVVRKGLFRRATTRGVPIPPAAAGPHPELDVPDPESLHIPISSFGYVTLADSLRLAGALRRDVAGWPRARVRFAGGTALEFKGDESVWAKLDGDLDVLQQIGRGVPQSVQALGFFVDRRVFRPWLSVGTITDQTTAPYLQGVVDALEGFRGQEWTIEHVSLLERPAQAGTTDAFRVYELMPLGG